MPAQHVDGDLQSLARKLDFAARDVLDESVLIEFLEHARHRSRRDAQRRRQSRRGDAGSLALETIDRFEILLDRFRKMAMAGHAASQFGALSRHALSPSR